MNLLWKWHLFFFIFSILSHNSISFIIKFYFSNKVHEDEKLVRFIDSNTFLILKRKCMAGVGLKWIAELSFSQAWWFVIRYNWNPIFASKTVQGCPAQNGVLHLAASSFLIIYLILSILLHLKPSSFFYALFYFWNVHLLSEYLLPPFLKSYIRNDKVSGASSLVRARASWERSNRKPGIKIKHSLSPSGSLNELQRTLVEWF